METLTVKKEHRIVRKGINGVGTMYWLDHGQNGLFNTLHFPIINVKKRPEKNIYVCVFEFRNNVVGELIRLPFDKFIEQYGIKKASVTFQPYSEIFLEISISLGNELVMLTNDQRVNYGSNPGEGKIEYSEVSDFEFEMTYELY